jgi:hypothetical protein
MVYLTSWKVFFEAAQKLYNENPNSNSSAVLVLSFHLLNQDTNLNL